MLGADECEMMGRMWARRTTARVLIFSAQTEAIFATRALGAGASAYVTTTSGSQEMNKAIGAAAAGIRYLSAEFAQTLALRDYAVTQRAAMSNREAESSGCWPRAAQSRRSENPWG